LTDPDFLSNGSLSVPVYPGVPSATSASVAVNDFAFAVAFLLPAAFCFRLGLTIKLMDPSLRRVTSLPLEELWQSTGPIIASRGRRLNAEDIANLLRVGRVQFVIADVGHPLQWIDLADCYNFWKSEVKPHLAVGERIVLDDFPDSYCYIASEWNSAEQTKPIVLLERAH